MNDIMGGMQSSIFSLSFKSYNFLYGLGIDNEIIDSLQPIRLYKNKRSVYLENFYGKRKELDETDTEFVYKFITNLLLQNKEIILVSKKKYIEDRSNIIIENDWNTLKVSLSFNIETEFGFLEATLHITKDFLLVEDDNI